MLSDERSKYKSWSNLKKQMGDLLCDSLKGKITYFYTTYREVHDNYGRATINYEKEELVAFSWHMRYEQWEDEHEVLKNNNVNVRNLGSLTAVWEKQKQIQQDLSKEKWMPECVLSEGDFIDAINRYLKTDVASALNSDNYILRVFAYMDRRVGKRTLIKIKDEVEALPEWVKQFYRLRCEADGIVFPPKRITDESVVCLTRNLDN